MKRCLYLSRSGRTYGPYSIESVRQLVASGAYALDEFAWSPGIQGWRTLKEVFRQLENEHEIGRGGLVGESPLEQAEKIWKLVEKDQLNLAIDLHLALNSPAVSIAIIEKIGFHEGVGFSSSNLQMPPGIDPEHGFGLFFSCLNKLLEVNQVPERFFGMEEFRLDFHLPLSALESLKRLPSLKSLTLSFLEAEEEEDLTFFENFSNLCELKISHAYDEEFGFLAKLPNLTSLTLENCENLREIPRLACKKVLRTASFSNCANLGSIDGLTEATSLEKLNLFGCEVLADLSPLEACLELATLDLRCCSSLREEGPLSHMEVEDVFLGGCPLLFTHMGRKLRSSSLSSLSMVWDGSGDDGWYEGTAYDREGREVEGEEASDLLATVEDFVCMKLPGGAGNDAGSYGVMEVDVLRGQATWKFHWRNGLQTFRERVEKWTDFDRLKLEFGFVVRIREDQPSNANDWSDVGTEWGWCFDEYDGEMAINLKEATVCRNGNWEEAPVEDFSGMEDMLEKWKSDTYYGEVEDTFKRLYNGCTGDLPDYLLERDLVVEFDLEGNEVEFSHDCNSVKFDLELEQESEIFPLEEQPKEE
jgi:hypothetical protein